MEKQWEWGRQEAGAAPQLGSRRPALQCLGSQVSGKREKPQDCAGPGAAEEAQAREEGDELSV